MTYDRKYRHDEPRKYIDRLAEAVKNKKIDINDLAPNLRIKVYEKIKTKKIRKQDI